MSYMKKQCFKCIKKVSYNYINKYILIINKCDQGLQKVACKI